MQCVEKCGEHYGLKLNWQNVEMLRVRSNAVVKNSSGMAITCKESLIYLGTCLTADGRIAAELSRRIGAASSEFKALHA
eukprot:4324258-Pyramimonas_sp.AAC.1